MRGLGRLFSVLLEWTEGIRLARSTVALATLTGLVAGVGSTALVAAINTALQGPSGDLLDLDPLPTFAVLCAVVPVSGLVSQVLLIRLTSRAMRDLRLRLADRILGAPYRLLEEIGPSRLLATLTDDIGNVAAAIAGLPVLLMQLGIIAGSLAYLGLLSWPLLVAVVVYMGLGIATHAIPMGRSMKHFRRVREEWDRMFEAFRDLTDGAKELKLNQERRRIFLAEELRPPVDAIRHANVWANGLALAAGNWGQALFFLFIGMVVFATPAALEVGAGATTGYALTILFMITPLTIIVHTMPTFARALVAAEKVRALGLSLDRKPAERGADGEAGAPWRSLELVGVTHAYRTDLSAEVFELGPIDLCLVPGELVFVIGGNGSGKTTLAKLLTGLYEPAAGEILLDGRPVTAETRDGYRQLFSAVFSDFRLFPRLVGPAPALEDAGRDLLVSLQLEHKVSIEGARLSTVELSQGQRKRLALLLARLEGRSIYVFDEWAADQDPAFREVFYRRILPELRAEGRTVIVITHDDRYYDVADRVIKLERGRVEPPGGKENRCPRSARAL